MARYHFSTHDGVVSKDPDGVEFADNAAAKREAACFLGECLRDRPDEFGEDRHLELTVTNDDGVTMWVLTAQLVHGPGDPRVGDRVASG